MSKSIFSFQSQVLNIFITLCAIEFASGKIVLGKWNPMNLDEDDIFSTCILNTFQYIQILYSIQFNFLCIKRYYKISTIRSLIDIMKNISVQLCYLSYCYPETFEVFSSHAKFESSCKSYLSSPSLL